MVEKSVIWTDVAANQSKDILEYWIRRNGSTYYSEKLIGLIDNLVKTILKNPEIFKKTDFPDTRVPTLGQYSLYYKTSSNKIFITAFWDNRHDPSKLVDILSKAK